MQATESKRAPTEFDYVLEKQIYLFYLKQYLSDARNVIDGLCGDRTACTINTI